MPCSRLGGWPCCGGPPGPWGGPREPSNLPSVMLLFLYWAAILFHSSTVGTLALWSASSGSATGVGGLVRYELSSKMSMKPMGIRPGPPSLRMGFATTHSRLDWAMMMRSSSSLAVSSSGRPFAASK